MMDKIDVCNIENYDYYLPEELIAQSPSLKRDHSRLMVLNKDSKTIEHHNFYEIIDFLRPGDVLVRNNSKVIPARLFGVKEITNAKVEVLLLKDLGDDVWECLCGNAKTIKLDTIISFGNGELKAKCVEIKDEGIRRMKLIYNGILFEILDLLGKMPLPPYIKKQCDDNSRYQTVYAKYNGSAAAPTAGLHFTDELLKKIEEKGVKIANVTLHVGIGTFRPVKEKNIEDHHMHTEHYYIKSEDAEKINSTKLAGNRVIAVGTTSCRTIETVADKNGLVRECEGDTGIYIYPGYKFKCLDGLITNFHLPESTLLMLVSALAGRENVLNAYNEAVKEKYKFFSFGDAMFIK